MSSPKYEYSVFNNIAETLSDQEQSNLHTSLLNLGSQCFDPIPNYQVFVQDKSLAFQNKILVTATTAATAAHEQQLVAFVSAVSIPMPTTISSSQSAEAGLAVAVVVHSGLTVIHHDHRKTKRVIERLFANLFLHLLQTHHPRGVWMTTVAPVVSSLVHMSRYLTPVFPYPYPSSSPSPPLSMETTAAAAAAAATTKSKGPSPSSSSSPSCPPSEEEKETIRLISAEFDRNHRQVCDMPPSAYFDSVHSVFRKSRAAAESGGGGDASSSSSSSSHQKDTSSSNGKSASASVEAYYRGLMRRGEADEVLQVGYLDPVHLVRVSRGSEFREEWEGRYSKL